MKPREGLDFVTFAYFLKLLLFNCRQRRNWGPGQCFAPQMGSSVCEHQCGSWQGLRWGAGGDGQIAMAHAPIQIIPGPMQQWRTCWGPGWHSL